MGNTISKIKVSGVTYDIIDESKLISINYSQLVTLRNNDELVPGAMYRITDYRTTTVQDGTSAIRNDFDIIVTATSPNTLNENAMAIRNDMEVQYGHYYDNSNLEAWELKYSLGNDTTKFAWADSTNGCGVIYYMKDEFGNEAPYDFKCIRFKPNKDVTELGISANTYYYTFSYQNGSNVNDLSLLKTCHDNKIGIYYLNDKQYISKNIFLSSHDLSAYNNVLGDNCHNNLFGDACSDNKFERGCHDNTFDSECYYNTFGTNCANNVLGGRCYSAIFGNDCSSNLLGDGCGNNVFKKSCNGNTLYTNCLHNLFESRCRYNKLGDSSSYNYFEKKCQNNTLGNGCERNTFDASCSGNTFSGRCSDNKLGNLCKGNVFASGCSENTFDASCSGNTFSGACCDNKLGNLCKGNVFASGCSENTFGTSCEYNSFGESCNNNTFGKLCKNNTFGNGCGVNLFNNSCTNNVMANTCLRNTFGNNCNNITFEKEYSWDNIIEANNQSITLTADRATSPQMQLKNVTIAQGTNESDTVLTITHSLGNIVPTKYQSTNSQIINL